MNAPIASPASIESLVHADVLQGAVNKLKGYGQYKISRVSCVNWRGGYQIKVSWKGGVGLECYLDFGKNHAGRSRVLRAAHSFHAPKDYKPVLGYVPLDEDRFAFESNAFISINDIATLALDMGEPFTVLYVQSSISARPLFADMGIGLVPGEMGKEWIDGEFVGYRCETGKCL